MDLEALQEVEALAAIFDDDFEKTADTIDTFTIKLRPYSTPYFLSIILRVQYIKGYPEVAPITTCFVEKGLSDKQLTEVTHLVIGAVQDNLGTPLVFAVADIIREWLEKNNEPVGDGSGFEEMMKRQRAAHKIASGLSERGDESVVPSTTRTVRATEDESEARKRDGTPVTAESFALWRSTFDREIEAKRIANELAGVVDTFTAKRVVEGRLTGRQLFESDAALVFSDTVVEDSSVLADSATGGIGATMHGAIIYAVDASLYGSDALPNPESGDSDGSEDFAPGSDDSDIE